MEVEVAFESRVKERLFMNKSGTIIGPDGTEMMISMSEAVMAGYNVQWTGGKLEVSKEGMILPTYLNKDGAPVLPNEVCLELIDDIERIKEAQKKTTKEDVKLESIWPQLKNALNWLLKNRVESAAEFVALMLRRRRKELDDEETQGKLMMKDEKDSNENILKIEEDVTPC